MRDNSVTRLIKNTSRGRSSYRRARHKISRAISDAPGDEIGNLSDFQVAELFSLENKSWIVLSFERKDWNTLAQLNAHHSHNIDRNYLRLLCAYVVANANRIEKLYSIANSISNAVLRDDGESVTADLERLDKTDRQSLFAFNIVCAQLSLSSEKLKQYFEVAFKTDWLRKRFLYPLIYHAINQPADDYLDTFLSYVITGEEHEAEKETIKFLLRDDAACTLPIAFKAYIALLCHPFDACEILLDHVESEFVAKGSVDEDLLGAVKTIDQHVVSSRIRSIYRLISRRTFKTSNLPNVSAIVEEHGFDQEFADFLQQFLAHTPNQNVETAGLPTPLAVLARMRNAKYPNVSDFEFMVPNGRKWRFTNAGRIINALLSSIYMVPRCRTETELRDFLRLLHFSGQICPFLLASPSSVVALSKQLVPVEGDQNLLAFCDTALSTSSSYRDRFWIKAVNWSLQQFEHQMRITDWLATVRRDIRVAPSFLTGIEWEWVEKVIKSARLKPFRGNKAGVYALLLMQIEEPKRDITVLRAAFEPFVEGKSLGNLIEWLIMEYGEEAIAFVRYFLMPDIILMLGLAPNEMAATAGRVIALKDCAKKFGFNALLPREVFEQESRVLTTALALKNVNSGQFEIPWSMFRRDAVAQQKDLYNAYLALRNSNDGSPILSNERISTPIRFRNGNVVLYTLKNSDWPLANLIITIVQDFLQHPSFGLEVLLSTRFRHDTLRREFHRAVIETKEQELIGVARPTQVELVDRLSENITNVIATWLDRRMHTRRPARPDGMFNLIPSQEQLETLATELTIVTEFEGIVERLSQWIKIQLDQQLENARTYFHEELGNGICESIDKNKELILAENTFRQSDVTRVTSALSTTFSRKTDQLVEWFKGSDVDSRQPMTFEEVKWAVDGLFETEIANGTFNARFPKGAVSDHHIAADKVRLCFDMVSEVFNNALKHSAKTKTRVSIRGLGERKAATGLIFSNSAPISEPYTREIVGERYNSETESLFTEGKSGLVKIACLAATIMEKDAKIIVSRRRRSFHLLVELWPDKIP